MLFGTCSTWFFLDIAYYAQNLFLPNILSDLGWAPKMNIHDPATVCECLVSGRRRLGRSMWSGAGSWEQGCSSAVGDVRAVLRGMQFLFVPAASHSCLA